ncbi:Lsr2 family protein (plasmid) [Mycolicibacterium sp. TY66]|uniref:histone-like nucleoid-structuring protein Lsr2 n=1 Tax=unclassified Mycolicibacterium TaxID=2636767 RepID=UPI001BB34F56|nr:MULTISPECIES: Lsr2 family protein [unclassified Mycolicibacterium]BCI84662.1 Lsr2 family protein [Mycolicibacterium sp. TY66]BCJ84892.1 Lsr2 family protein [Mycolicibacterium sp. TY81]
MGQYVTTHYVDDYDGSPIDGDAIDAVDFSYRGKTYKLELNAKNGAQFDKDIQKWIDAAEKAAANTEAPAPRKARSTTKRASAKSGKAARAGRRKASASTSAAAGREQSRAIREWAKASGIEVPARGRIPAAVVEAYNNAP